MNKKQKPLNPMQVVMRLKPERVQELLAKLPGWRLRQDGLGLEHVRSFTSSRAARSFVGHVCKLSDSRRQPVKIRLAGKQVTVTLQGHPAVGCTGGINGAVFNLAGQIG